MALRVRALASTHTRTIGGWRDTEENAVAVIPAGLPSSLTDVITVTPAAGQTGAATITVAVSDGQSSASTAFLLTVTATPAGLVAAYGLLIFLVIGVLSSVNMKISGAFEQVD